MKRLDEALRALPPLDPPVDGWERLQARMDQPVRHKALLTVGGGAMAVAASVLMAVVLLRQPTLQSSLPGVVAKVASSASSSAGPGQRPATGGGHVLAAMDSAPDVQRLIARSQSLERALQRVRPQVVVWDDNLAARSAAIERGLQVVDLQLNYAEQDQSPEQVRLLWANRVSLMTELLKTHEAATLAPALMPRENIL